VLYADHTRKASLDYAIIAVLRAIALKPSS